MATYEDKWNCTGYTPAKSQANNLLQKLAKKLFKAVSVSRKPEPNLFHERYAEKFENKDQCQWRGGRLLTNKELQQYMTNKKGK